MLKKIENFITKTDFHNFKQTNIDTFVNIN
jgi:hypothetical protein